MTNTNIHSDPPQQNIDSSTRTSATQSQQPTAQPTQAQQTYQPKDRDGLINMAADSVIYTLYGRTLPYLLDQGSDVPEQIRDQILTKIAIAIGLENQNRARGDKLKPLQSLPGYIVARIVMRTGAIRIMYTGTSGYKIIAKQYHKEAGIWKWSGTYSVVDETDNTSQVMMIFQRLCPNGTKQDIATFVRELCKAPRVYLQDDNMLIWFRNGVWDYRTMSLTSYDDKDFDAKYPTQISLGKLPVYHPYGPGAVLKKDASGIVAEPVIHNDNDGTDWHPGQMLTDPFDMTTDEGKASSLIIWQAMQFMVRRLNGTPGLYHFWVNGNGRGHNGKSAIWSMMRRLIVKDTQDQGDDDLRSDAQRVIPASVESLGKDYNLAQNILTAYAIVGEESDSGSGTTYVDQCATAKMLARTEPSTASRSRIRSADCCCSRAIRPLFLPRKTTALFRILSSSALNARLTTADHTSSPTTCCARK